MSGHYPQHQEGVHVGTALTSNMLLHAKKEVSLHFVITDSETSPPGYYRKCVVMFVLNQHCKS